MLSILWQFSGSVLPGASFPVRAEGVCTTARGSLDDVGATARLVGCALSSGGREQAAAGALMLRAGELLLPRNCVSAS